MYRGIPQLFEDSSDKYYDCCGRLILKMRRMGLIPFDYIAGDTATHRGGGKTRPAFQDSDSGRRGRVKENKKTTPESYVVQCSADYDRDSVFTGSEKNLIRLGLNKAARGNEVDNSSVALFQSLRKRAVDADDIITASERTMARSSEASTFSSHLVGVC
jgi:hypothetical protein